MTYPLDIKECIRNEGFAIIPGIYRRDELALIKNVIDHADSSTAAFRKSNGLFAIRRFLLEVPLSHPFIFNDKLKQLISELFGQEYFVVKSIYFDKPEESNWFVAYHQDLTISVDKKIALDGYGPWTTKQDQFAVQPPLEILENNFTIRIHLDDTTE